ncbi:MAG: hypothetical protein LBK82_07825, partial [Planctomycetaceae bacterium]|nr:hypothetical protein [Planctomycetaceae bacterium]
MQVHEHFDPNPFRVNAYRTEEVLFIHILPSSWEKYCKQIKFFATIFCCLLLLFFCHVLTNNVTFWDATGGITVLVGISGLFVFYFYLRAIEQVLIRIDQNTIRKTTWYFKIGFFVSIKRIDKILFEKRNGNWCFVVDKDIVSLWVREHEFLWIRELVEQFEKEVPALDSDVTSEPSPVLDAAEIKRVLHILEDMEYQGQKLHKIPNPIKQDTFKKVAKNKLPDELPGTLHIRCSRCHSMLPTNYVLADTAMAQCPCCGFLFEVTDLKRYPLPRRSRIKFQTGENVLKLHQRPQFLGIPFLILSAIVGTDCMLTAYYIFARNINPDAALQIIDFIAPNGIFTPLARMTVIIGIVHVFCFVIFLWSIFVHRFIEFRLNEVWFRIRWLCFWWSWTVPRSRLEASRLMFLTQYLGFGFQIPYGKKSFYVGAGIFEIPWVVGEINYWLLTHPPDGFSVSDRFPKFENNEFDSSLEKPDNLTIGGVTEKNDKEIHWYCCGCGHRFLTEELDFPNHTASCSNCNKTFNLSQLQYYAVERIAVKPELSYFFVEKSETEQRIECSIISMKKLERYSSLLGSYIVLIFLAFMWIGLPCFLLTNFFIILNKHQEIDWITGIISIPAVLLLGSFLFYILSASIYD